MRIAFVSDELPEPGVAGHLLYNHAVLTWLAGLGVEVVVVLVGMRWARPVVRYRLFPVVGPHVGRRGEWVFVRSGRGLARVVGRAVRRRVRPVPAGVAVLGDVCGAADARWVAGWVRRAGVEAVLVDTVFRAPVLRGLGGVNSVLLAHDVFHERAAQMAAAGLVVRPAMSAEAEAALAGLARHVAAIQPAEAAVLARLCPAADVFAAPMPALPCPPPPRAAGRRLVFLGSAAPLNLAGLRWFLADIWPRLAGVTLDILGDAGTALGALPAGVVARGRVAEIAPWLHGADLAIAPLPHGSGLKIKLLDYARHGLTTVASPASLAGLAPGGPFIAAETAADFAVAIRTALAAPRATAAALAYIASHYAPDACFAPLAAALDLPA
jgi:hypothetical protein